MWNKIQYALIYSWVKIHAFLPMWALYILSDILYILIYKVVRYRVKVVRQNMKASFPDKSETELRQLEREFYHHFADYVVETIKLAHISLEELQRRVDSGEMAMALALYPVSMKQLMDIADTGNIMPPKTTWFEPKLRSGLVIHDLAD